MQDNKSSHSHSVSSQESGNRLQTGILLGWAVLFFVVIMVAAALSRIIAGDISADETLPESASIVAQQEAVSTTADTHLPSDPLQFSDSWIRATPPGATTAAAYLVIQNSGTDDRLLEIHSSLAPRVELHSTREQSGMMQMSRVASLHIPASGKAELAPGRDHIMFIELTHAFVPGDTETLILHFEKAGTREVSFTVRDPRSEQ